MDRIRALIETLTSLQAAGPVRVLEIGTIRNLAYEATDGHSTRYVAELIRPEDQFYSIDRDCSIAITYLANLGLDDRVGFFTGDSLAILPGIQGPIDLVYLDGENDAKQTLAEFLQVWPQVRPGGYCIVDDCYPDSRDVVKSHGVLTWLKSQGHPYEVINNQLTIQKPKK